ncbi:MAG: excinuclease ABC subunit C [Glaciecola sp.]
MTDNEHIKSILKSLPKSPGVYQYYDAADKILYIGKAKNLKNRVRSYFSTKHLGKTRLLVAKIRDIKFILVETEQEALLLENSLIKKHQPPYNIQLKDDKTFPWVCIKKERFPRVLKVRKVLRDGSEYFGPYSNVRMLDTLLELIHKLYPLRNCSFNLSEQNVSQGKFKLCLEYHVGNCMAPCEGKENEKEYLEKIEEIKLILKGNVFKITKVLKQKMQDFSDKLAFEKAHLIKEKLLLLEKHQSKYTVVSPTISNLDVFSIFQSGNNCFVNFLRVINGAIVQGHTVEVKPKLDETAKEILEGVIANFETRFNGLAKEVVVPFAVDVPIDGIKCFVPQRGDKMKLLLMSNKNAKYFGQEKSLRQKPQDNFVLTELQKNLRLTELPMHIECFDNSNIQGTNPMSACVVFKNGKPSNKDYRLFNIMTVDGPDDFASMEEVVFRRYSRLLSEGKSLPQLIIIDGGKGQLSSALKSLSKLNLRGKMAIIGIAKRLEEIYFPGDSLPLYIDKRSSSLKLIQQLRNEAHRFSLKGHRNSRSNSMIKSELEEIKGIGQSSIQELLRIFQSVANIKEKKESELSEIVGSARAKKIKDHFNNLTT